MSQTKSRRSALFAIAFAIAIGCAQEQPAIDAQGQATLRLTHSLLKPSGAWNERLDTKVARDRAMADLKSIEAQLTVPPSVDEDVHRAAEEYVDLCYKRMAFEEKLHRLGEEMTALIDAGRTEGPAAADRVRESNRMRREWENLSQEFAEWKASVLSLSTAVTERYRKKAGRREPEAATAPE